MIRASFLLLAFLSLSANASLVWTTDLDAAKQRARGEKKLILLATKSAEKLLADAEQHEALVHSLENFVLVRENAGAPLRFLIPRARSSSRRSFCPT